MSTSTPKKQHPPIVISLNDAYLYPACLFLFSAAVNAKDKFRVVLAHDSAQLSKEAVNLLRSVSEKLNIAFEVFPISTTRHLPDKDHLKSIVYSRLIVLDTFSESFVWLDVDLLPLENWQVIYDAIDENAIACAVPEAKRRYTHATLEKYSEYFGGNLAFKKNGLRYFNSGVIYLNVDKWRELPPHPNWRELLDKYDEYGFQWADQCILNFILGTDYTEFPAGFNANASGKRLIPDIKILHFDGSIKPWQIKRNLFFNFRGGPGRAIWSRNEREFLRFAQTLGAEDFKRIRISSDRLISRSWLRDFVARLAGNNLRSRVMKFKESRRSQ
jgi:lipopolysaccharide biosynthesis glycosyltransferase